MRPIQKREPPEPQNWESMVHLGADYVRAGDLAAWVAARDAELDAATARTLTSVAGLDALIRRTAPHGAVYDAYHAPPSDAWAFAPSGFAEVVAGLLEGAALVCWNGAREGARRLQNEGSTNPNENEEDWRAANRRRSSTPFRTLDEVLRFRRDGLHPDEDRPGLGHAIGMGPLSLVVAEDRDEDVRARARLLANGRPVPAGSRRTARRHPLVAGAGTGAELLALITDEAPAVALAATRYHVGAAGGYLPIDFQPCKQTAAGSHGGARGLATINLDIDVADAVQAARLSADDEADLADVHLGRWVRPPRKGRRGDLGDERGAAQEVLREVTLKELARDRGEAVQETRDRLSAARGRLRCQLERRGLLPGVRDAEPGLPRTGRRAHHRHSPQVASYDTAVLA